MPVLQSQGRQDACTTIGLYAMMLPEDETDARRVRAPSEGDTYDLSEPAAPVKRPPPAAAAVPSILERGQPPEAADQCPAEPTRLPFLLGVFNFPWYLRTVAAWGMISIGLTVTLLGVVVCIYLADMGFGVIAVRCFGVPVLLVATLSLSYASACALTVIETTAEGYDEVTDWPAGFWRDWFFTMVAVLVMLALAMAIGGVIGKWLGIGTWLPAACTAYLFFPVFALSALEAGSATVLVSWPVVRSFWSVWWGWLLFYLETGVLIALWVVPTAAAFRPHPWLTSLIAGPLLAAVILIYARLIGRLAWCLGEYGGEEGEE